MIEQLSLLDDPRAADEFSEEGTPQRVQPGEIWRLGKHRLMCADATSWENIQKLAGGGGC